MTLGLACRTGVPWSESTYSFIVRRLVSWPRYREGMDDTRLDRRGIVATAPPVFSSAARFWQPCPGRSGIFARLSMPRSVPYCGWG